MLLIIHDVLFLCDEFVSEYQQFRWQSSANSIFGVESLEEHLHLEQHLIAVRRMFFHSTRLLVFYSPGTRRLSFYRFSDHHIPEIKNNVIQEKKW